MKTIQDHKAEAALKKQFRYPEGIFTRAEYMELQKRNGATVKEKQVRQHVKEEREAERLKMVFKNMPFGNSEYPTCKQYYKDKALLDAGFFTTEYCLYFANGSTSIVITKAEYEYFNKL